MALRYAIATGNWSNTATWDGGTLPTASDDVFADGKTVTIDIDITVLSIRTTQRSGGTNGGTFTCTTSRTLTCDVISGGAIGLTLSTNGTVVNVIGNVTSGAFIGVSSNAIGNSIVIQGNCTAGQAAAVSIGTSPIISILGNIIGSSTTNVACVSKNGGSISVIGNVSGNIGIGVFIVSGGSLVMSGNATASTRAALDLQNANTSITITGDITASTTEAGLNALINVGANQNVVVNGNLYASSSFPAVHLNLNTILTFTGNAFGLNGVSPFFAFRVKVDPSNNQAVIFQDTSNNDRSFATTSGLPSTANVRDGISYDNGVLTGTLKVPSASSVAVGVPIDNTVGTAIISVSDMGALLASYNV
jgi:hypothetical protein